MFVDQLAVEAADVFQINAVDVLLMLFGMHPRTLSRNNRLSDSPRVGPGSTILVLCIAGHAMNMGGRGPMNRHFEETKPDSGAMIGSKILGSFKLPKFDGNSRYWKTWEKNFVRFLSIHQLDFVIEETFLDILPLSPRAFGANKMVYYILEDALTPGSLAAKYFRQAAKWNGIEAYLRLHDGYVFSGP
jgi:hypothetical protein